MRERRGRGRKSKKRGEMLLENCLGEKRIVGMLGWKMKE